MLKLRMQIIDNVLKSPDTASIESILYSTLKHKYESGTELKRLLRFIPSLENDIRFALQQSSTRKTKKNLNEVLRLIKAGVNVKQISNE
jgi:hypothetical protein